MVRAMILAHEPRQARVAGEAYVGTTRFAREKGELIGCARKKPRKAAQKSARRVIVSLSDSESMSRNHVLIKSPVVARGKGRRRAAGRARKEEDEDKGIN